MKYSVIGQNRTVNALQWTGDNMEQMLKMCPYLSEGPKEDPNYSKVKVIGYLRGNELIEIPMRSFVVQEGGNFNIIPEKEFNKQFALILE